MKVARISYLNTDPFFYRWDADAFPIISGTPRALAQAAAQGRVDAGPLPIVETWALEDTFEPLASLGIASREKCGSVFLYSRKPLSELKKARVGLTTESSTSVRLGRVLLEQKYECDAVFHREPHSDDDAWLVIGDQALKYAAHGYPNGFTVQSDLATEWWTWKKLPFVFAGWVVRKNKAAADKKALTAMLTRSFNEGQKHFTEIAEAASKTLGLNAPPLEQYLRDFQYVWDDAAEQSMALFRELCQAQQPAWR